MFLNLVTLADLAVIKTLQLHGYYCCSRCFSCVTDFIDVSCRYLAQPGSEAKSLMTTANKEKFWELKECLHYIGFTSEVSNHGDFQACLHYIGFTSLVSNHRDIKKYLHYIGFTSEVSNHGES